MHPRFFYKTYGLALDATGSQTGSQMLLDAHEQDHDGQDRKQRCCEQVLPLDHVVAVEDVDTS